MPSTSCVSGRVPMADSRFAGLCAIVLTATVAVASTAGQQVQGGGQRGGGRGQRPPPVGIPRTPLGEGPWIFDTAEQHKIRVVVVTKALANPWSVAFLPDGTALITERAGRLRILRNGVL